jgi:ATP-dependent RNA helicase DDX19/DBP5
MSRFGKHGLAINLVDGPRSMALLKDIERHFGKDIIKLDAEVCLFINFKLNLIL